MESFSVLVQPATVRFSNVRVIPARAHSRCMRLWNSKPPFFSHVELLYSSYAAMMSRPSAATADTTGEAAGGCAGAGRRCTGEAEGCCAGARAEAAAAAAAAGGEGSGAINVRGAAGELASNEAKSSRSNSSKTLGGR